MKPRPYQRKAVRAAIQAEESRILLVAPGGSGKTVMIAMLAKHYLAQGARVLVLSHRRELIDQAVTHFGYFRISEDKIGLVLRGWETAKDKPLQCGSIQTAINRRLGQFDVVIIDEAHHVPAATYTKLLRRYRKARVFGLTATPQRLDGKALREFFDLLIEAAKPSELIEQGFISKPRIFVPPEDVRPTLDGVRMLAGDYVMKDLNTQVNKRHLVGALVDHYLEHGKNRRGIVFAASILHAEKIKRRFRRDGIKAEVLSAATLMPMRRETLHAFREGEVRILISCMILAEGIDVPTCDVVMLARPTLSQTLFLQQCGRGMRPHGRNIPVILDHAGNTLLHGLPYADRVFSLDAGIIGVQHAPGRRCPKCGWVTTAAVCPECGFILPPPEPNPVDDLREVGLPLEELRERRVQALRDRLRQFLTTRGEDDPAWVARVLGAWKTRHGV